MKEGRIRAPRRTLDEMTEQQILQVYWSEPLSLREIAKNFGVSHMSVWRLVSASARPV